MCEDNCPRCDVPLRHVKAEYEYGFLFIPAYSICPKCDWQPGDEELLCEMCGEWCDNRVALHNSEHAKDDDQVCLECAKEYGIKCPQCGEWDAKKEHGEHVICKLCVDEVIVKHEAMKGYREERVTA